MEHFVSIFSFLGRAVPIPVSDKSTLFLNNISFYNFVNFYSYESYDIFIV